MLKRRVKTLETTETRSTGAQPFAVVTVSDVVFEKNETGQVITYAGSAIYMDAERTDITKDERGVWHYDDGSAKPVSGLVVIVREGLNA